MDGFEATRRIRSSAQPGNPDIPIVAVTADAMRDDRDRCMREGMNDYLAKPVELDRLRMSLPGGCPYPAPVTGRKRPGSPPVGVSTSRKKPGGQQPFSMRTLCCGG